MNHIRALVFDLDGTLVTSNLNFSAIRAEIGCAADEDVLEYLERLEPDARAEAESVIHRHEVEDALQSEWIAGAREFVNDLREANFPLAILTRNSDYSSRVKISRNQIPIPYLVTRENSKPKPDPQALNRIAASFSIAPEKVLMVGDYKYDLQAGRNAAMPTCLVNFEGTPDYLHLADFSFSTVAELHREFFAKR